MADEQRWIELADGDRALDRYAAARQGNAAKVRVMREHRDAEDEMREELAREIGFEVCSTRQG